MAILEHAEGTGVDFRPLRFLLLLFWHGRGARQAPRCRNAPHQRHRESARPIRQLHCDSPVPKLVGSFADKPNPAPSKVSLSCNAPSISAQMEANCLPAVSTTTLAWR